MILETFKITLKHDTGKITVKIDSLSGAEGAIAQILASEGCLMGAIIKVKIIEQKEVN